MRLAACFAMILLSTSAFAAGETKEFNATGLRTLVVRNTSGNIKISETSDSKAVVKIDKVKFSDHCSITTERNNEQLVVRVEKIGFFSFSDCEVNFDIALPRKIDLNLVAGSGDFNIAGIEGELRFKAGSGTIEAEGAFSRIKGETGSGNIDVKGLASGGDLWSGSGTISLAFGPKPPKGDISIHTGSGDVSLLVPKDSKIRTHFRAGSGEMTNEIGDTPDAEFRIDVKTGSGDLKIKSYRNAQSG